MRDLDIAEVVKRSAVPASTLRFYEEEGLIKSIGRQGLRRQFDESVLERLALISLGRSAGFSLTEIRRMFAPDGRPAINRQMLLDKADELDRTIRKHQLDARRLASRGSMLCAEPHGVSDVSPVARACGERRAHAEEAAEANELASPLICTVAFAGFLRSYFDAAASTSALIHVPIADSLSRGRERK